jgi:hypothetical protein
MALSKFGRGRRRRPSLRVVSHSLGGTPRHVTAWTVDGVQRFVNEFWTLAEWEALTEAERPEGAAFLPGVGYLILRIASAEEWEDANEHHKEELERYWSMRGIQS